MQEQITLEVTRYRPEMESKPVLQSYEVPLNADWVVLDALNYIKDEIDGTLSFRWSCRMGVCGSCGMMVNGKPELTCSSYLKKLAPGPVRVEPLEYFPIIRDLVIDMDDFLNKLKRVKPWIIRDEEGSDDQEYLQTPDERENYSRYSMCINCMLCYSACPVFGLEPDFAGPAALALAQRYNKDNRDKGSEQRMEELSDQSGIWQCTFVGDCSAVCPKDVDPAGAIQRYKVEGAASWWKNLLLPKGGNK